jgi:hypothetical protein
MHGFKKHVSTINDQADYRRASFLWHVFISQIFLVNFACVGRTKSLWQGFGFLTGHNSYYYRHYSYTCSYTGSLTDRIQVFILLCQMFFVDNFFHDKYTFQKLAYYSYHVSFWTSALVAVKIVKFAKYRRANKTCHIGRLVIENLLVFRKSGISRDTCFNGRDQILQRKCLDNVE